MDVPRPGGTKFTLHPEHSNYNFVERRLTAKPTNVLESIIHLVKGCLGGGIMGIHEAFMKAGLWTGVVATVLFGFYITYCVHIIVSSAQLLYKRLHVPDMSYPDVAEASMQVGPFESLKKYSKCFRYAVDLTICIDLFGSCCVYEIIIAKSVQQLVSDSDDKTELRMWIASLLVPILLLGMIRSLKYLAPFSLVADIFIVVCVISTVYYALKIAGPISEVPAWKNLIGFFEFCGVVVFSMEGVGVALPIENNMKDPHKFPIVLCCGMLMVVSFSMTVGFFGYWGFLETSTSPVTLNFPKDAFPSVLKAMMAINIFITFALNFWAPFNLVWYYICRSYDPSKHWIWERVYRAIIITIISIVAIIFPNIGNLMGLLGSFCLSMMGFIFPAMIELLVCWENPGLGKFKWVLWKNVAIIILGVFLGISGTYSNVKGLITNL